jgi:hypothetical protein
MGLKMGRIDYQLVGFTAHCRKRHEDVVEHHEPASADKAVVDRLVRTVIPGSIAPAQGGPDYEDDPADHPTIINPRHPM